MSSRSFSWLATPGGAWSLPSNWDDLTDGIDPALIAPGPQDSVSITGATGGQVTVIIGPGSAASAAFFANVSLAGSYAFGALSVGTDDNGGLLAIGAASSVTAVSATIASGSLLASGAGAALSVSGVLTLGGGGSANLDATSGGRIQLGTLDLGASSASIYADAASSIEIGATGGALPGALTIDAGATLSGLGDANGYAPVINNGTIEALGGALLVGPLTGNGVLSIGAASVLQLNGATAAGQSVDFAGSAGTLAVSTEFDGPHGTVAGFAPGDAIDILGSPISAATLVPEGKGVNLLSFYYGNQVALTMTLLGNYSNDIFLTANDGAGGTLITVSPQSNGGGTLSGGTTNPDQYLWTPTTGGAWDVAGNWQDLTTGANPARVAPGKNNLVSIACAQQGSFSVISGPADAAALAITGDLAMSGTFAIGSLVLGTTANYGTVGNLDLLPQTMMSAQSLTINDGELSLTGGTVLSVAGTLAMGGGSSGVGLPVTALSLSSGATLTAAGLTLGGGSGNTITTDPTAVLEIGAAGRALAGAVSVNAGATLSGNGSVNPFGALVDNGTISAVGGVLALGAVTGSGVLTIADNAALLLDASTAVNIAFTGANGILAVANELVSASGSITGFTAGDAIDIEGDAITSVSVSKFVGGVTLTLYYNATPVAHFLLAGVYTGDRFFLTPDGGFGTNVLVDTASGQGGGGGQGNTDLLSWSQPVSGYWNKAGNWFDVTTNAAATAPPGSLNAAQITGPSGFAFQTIGGPAVSASMAFFGNTYVSGAWSTGTLTVGGLPAGSTTETTGTLEVGAASGMNAANADVIDGLILVGGSSATLTVTGTLTLGSGGPDAQGPTAELSVTGGATATLGALAMGGGAGCQLLTDVLSSIEIGTLGDAQAGAVVLDTGVTVAGNGSINPVGLLVDNGTLTAQGGTLQLGNVSGTGVLSIGPAATLELLGTEACPIEMAGAGASLILAGASESLGAPISGFVQGDQIVIATGIVGSVAYAPGSGGVGTLTLYNGGQVAGTLLLAGDYSGDTFTVQPDGLGSLIGVQAGTGGPSQGTATPDDYTWIGGTGGSWNVAANWTDVSAGQNPALVAPGINDLITVRGGSGGYTSISGPANAASLTLLGEVALIGQFAAGALAVGQGSATGLLALGSGTSVQAGQAVVTGAVVAQGGTLSSTGTLALDAGVLIAGGGGVVQLASLVLSGSGNDVTVDAASVIEIGSAGGAATGTLTVDAGAVLAGVGVIDPTGQIADAGTITAMAGAAALSLGDVSGTGTLLVGVGGTLQLQGSAASSLLIDFAGPGTLSVTGPLPQAAIAGFGDGCAIDVPIQFITGVSFAITAPNVGILTLESGTQAVGALTLVGVGLGQAFSVTGAPGGTILTTTTNPSGGGGSNMRNVGPQSGSGQAGVISDFSFWQTLPTIAQDALAAFQAGISGTSYVWSSPDGSYFGPYEPGYANFAVVTAPPDTIAGNTIALPPGYEALLLQGNVPLRLTDGAGNHVLLLGNSGDDTIVGNGPGDTLVGGTGAHSVIFAANAATVQGGGSDSIISTASGAVSVTTAASGRSVVFAGASNGNIINLMGSDTFVGAGGAASETVTAAGSDTVFAPSGGQMNFYGGNGVDLVVGSTGTVRMFGGSGNGSVLWSGQAAYSSYYGGAGAAEVVGGSGTLFATGGAGPMTVYGGTGTTYIQGTPGASEFLAGFGASTISAASGNLVWLVGAANDSLVATGGNVTIWGANSLGNNVFQAGSGPCTISGGLGNDTFLGGTGSALILSGGGADVFSFTNGLAGGAATLNGFNTGADQIDLHGYSGYTNALVAGNEVLSLSDGTQITLAGISSMNGVIIHTV